MKRVLTVLALTGSAVLVPTAAFADVTVSPIFVVVPPSTGTTDVPAVVAGPPVPLGPYAKPGKDDKDAERAAREADRRAREDAHRAEEQARHDAREQAKHADSVALTAGSSSAAASLSPWDDASLVSGGGRKFG